MSNSVYWNLANGTEVVLVQAQEESLLLKWRFRGQRHHDFKAISGLELLSHMRILEKLDAARPSGTTTPYPKTPFSHGLSPLPNRFEMLELD